ncbi:hypothetical protein CFC21_110116 [Triticum aestivum]|uniref:F-box domain-containing protein n=2 Tax=Triticum aestivum TaxID=4565 RepID=A0A9R1NDK9_WHEAT|nr:hypothetical protein CFC21_110116 [Triticum aestivum]
MMLRLRASDSTPKVSDMKQRRRRRRRRCRKRGDAGVILPTELVLEILKRASPSTVARCAVTCRPWLRLVSRRSFARRAARPRRALLLGFFAFDHAEDDEQAMLPPRFVECPGGPAGWRCPCVPRLDPRCRDLDPVLSRNGYLVLSRAAVLAGTPTTINYCVCNPSTGLCHFLPPYRVHDDIGFWEYGCALLTGRDLRSRASPPLISSFELVLAAIHMEEHVLWVDSFSSSTMSWSPTRRLEIPYVPIAMVDEWREWDFRSRPRSRSPLRQSWTSLEMNPKNLPVVDEDGVIYWQCSRDHGAGAARVALALDMRWRGYVELLDLPGESRCSGAYWDFGVVLGCRSSDGALLAFGLAEYDGPVLKRWWTVKRSVDRSIPTGCTWHRGGDVDLRRAISSCCGGGDAVDDIGGVKLLWYCEKSNVLVFNTVALGSFALDLKTRRAEAVGEVLRCKSEFCARNACVWWRACPYEIDCPLTWITSPSDNTRVTGNERPILTDTSPPASLN